MFSVLRAVEIVYAQQRVGSLDHLDTNLCSKAPRRTMKDEFDESKVVRLFPEGSREELVPVGTLAHRSDSEGGSGNTQSGAWSEGRAAEFLDPDGDPGPQGPFDSLDRVSPRPTRVVLSGVAGAVLATIILALVDGNNSAKPTSMIGADSHPAMHATGQSSRNARPLVATGNARSSTASREPFRTRPPRSSHKLRRAQDPSGTATSTRSQYAASAPAGPSQQADQPTYPRQSSAPSPPVVSSPAPSAGGAGELTRRPAAVSSSKAAAGPTGPMSLIGAGTSPSG